MGFHSFYFCNFKWVKLKAKCFWEPHCSVGSGQENLQCTLLVLSLKNSFSFLSKSLPFSKHFMYSPRWLLAFLRWAISMAMLLNVFLISSKRTFFSASRFDLAALHSCKSFLRDSMSSSISWCRVHWSSNIWNLNFSQLCFPLFKWYCDKTFAALFSNWWCIYEAYRNVILDCKSMSWCWHVN